MNQLPFFNSMSGHGESVGLSPLLATSQKVRICYFNAVVISVLKEAGVVSGLFSFPPSLPFKFSPVPARTGDSPVVAQVVGWVAGRLG